MEKVETFLIGSVGLLIIYIVFYIPFMLGKEGNKKKVCESRSGTYSREICFKNEYIIKVD